MTTFTWNPTTLGQFAGWDTPSGWLPQAVPNAADADVVMPEITSGGQPYVFDVQIGLGESIALHSLTMTEQQLTVNGRLSVSGSVTLQAGSFILADGTLALSGLAMAPGTFIEGSGQVFDTGTLVNTATIQGSGMTLDLGGLTNTGMLAGNLTAEVPAAGFTNLSAGTLSLGTYEAVGGVLLIGTGTPIMSDAATIILDGDGATVETSGTTSLTATLQSIAAGGTLEVLNSVFDGALPLTVAGSVLLNGGTLETPGLTIEPGAAVSGIGVIGGPVVNNGSILATGGDESFLSIAGPLSGTGTVEIQSPGTFGPPPLTSLELGGAVSNTVAFADWNGVLTLDNPAAFGGEIAGFTTGADQFSLIGGVRTFEQSDTILLSGIAAGSVRDLTYTGTESGGTLSFVTQGSTIALNFTGDYERADFRLTAGPQVLSTSPPSLSITEVLPCFLAGTRLATPRGDVPVERLCVGDTVRTADGGQAAIAWIGQRRVEAARHAMPQDIWPVCIRAGAFGAARPARDLWLSPDHAIYLGGVLIPVRYLVNGATVLQERHGAMQYFHVELPRHGIVLAEGLACESYLDTGNRAAFANAGGAVQMQPDFARRIWESRACAPLVTEGPAVIAARRSLLRRAASLGFARTRDPALCLLADGRRLQPDRDGARWHVALPPGARCVTLASRVWVPAEATSDETDTRRLGIAVGRLWLDGREAGLDSAGLLDGWHAPEAKWRWTDGCARLDPAGARHVAFELAMTGRYWRERPGRSARAA